MRLAQLFRLYLAVTNACQFFVLVTILFANEQVIFKAEMFPHLSCK